MNTTLDIYLLFENGHKSTQTRCKVCSNLTKCITTIDFRLTSSFFINLEHLSHPTLVLLFILWIGKCWTLWTLCQNNTLMLTFTHNHAPGILLWQFPCHRNEKQNSESFFNYDANLTSVIIMELKFMFFFFAMLISLYDVISCDIINVKNFRESTFRGTSFKFWLRPWSC